MERTINFAATILFFGFLLMAQGLPVDDTEHNHPTLQAQPSTAAPPTTAAPNVAVKVSQEDCVDIKNSTEVETPTAEVVQAQGNQNNVPILEGEHVAYQPGGDDAAQLNSDGENSGNDSPVTVNLDVPNCPKITDIITASRDIMDALRKASGMKSGLEVMLNAAAESVASVAGCISKLLADFTALFSSGELARIIKGILEMAGTGKQSNSHYDQVLIVH